MPTSNYRLNFTLLFGMLAACSSTRISPDSVAGLYGCDPCSFGGSTLYLRANGTYSRCTFSDTPQFDGYFAREGHGSYRLDGQRLTLSPESPEMSFTRFVLRVRKTFYLVTEDEYEKFYDDYRAIENIGLKRRAVTPDSPYACNIGRSIED